VLDARPGETFGVTEVDCGSFDGPPESYRLSVGPDGVAFSAASDAGRARGLATLRQLGTSAPALVIEDEPRFAWRGVMLDVARHFFGVDDVLRLIGLAALYKLNVVHLHLTDDQGWRIEVPGWPRLTSVGASTAVGGGPGGFFSREDLARIVEHASSYAIAIVPEIDVPGHVNAALIAYPELWGRDAPEPFTTWSSPGRSLDVRSEIALRFIDEVVASLPGDYVHLGGDEVEGMPHDDYVKFMWDACSAALRHGKRPIVWEEAGVARLPQGTIVQHWSAPEPARAAASQRLPLIMSPAPHTYLDQKYDSSTELGLTWAGTVDVRDAYSWDPSSVISGASVLGVEAALWTETVETRDDLDYMVFPRLAAVAEVGWSRELAWDDFRARLAAHGPLLEGLGVQFHRSSQVDWA
jgi:hexosaminidase